MPYLARGGIVSVALSLRFPLVAVSNCPALRCPDFPPFNKIKWRSANNLTFFILSESALTFV